jgi:predicted PhzF superfamily epimerase YddE/YHI9
MVVILLFCPGKRFALRWFTPTAEVPLCGHATLATAHVIFNELANKHSSIVFETLSGELTVSRTDSASANRLMMDFPQYEVVSFDGVGSNPKIYRLSKSV